MPGRPAYVMLSLVGPTPKFCLQGLRSVARSRPAGSLKCRGRRDRLTRDVRRASWCRRLAGRARGGVVCLPSCVKLEGRRAPGRCGVTGADRGAAVEQHRRRRRRPNCRHQTAACRSDDAAAAAETARILETLITAASTHESATTTSHEITKSASTERCTVIWATNQLGDRGLGDKLTGRQPTGRHVSVNWAT